MDDTIFNLRITDPGDGNTITTVLIDNAPAEHPHRINVTRKITVEAAPYSDILLLMPIPGGMPDEPPWQTYLPYLGRHFIVSTGGEFILGGTGSGNLIVDGNSAALFWARRGGVLVECGELVLEAGGVIQNNFEYRGGGVAVNGANALFIMNGGEISGNSAIQMGGGVTQMAGIFNMNGGRITNNLTFYYGGGGVVVYLPEDASSAVFNMNHNAVISGNFAHTGGGVFVKNGGIFNMMGGQIYNHRYRAFGVAYNHFILYGGGVGVGGPDRISTFRFTGGVIGHSNTEYGNAAFGGGGVWVGDGSRFYMEAPAGGGIGGTIMGNHAPVLSQLSWEDRGHGGGGVYLTDEDTVFTMSAGTIQTNRTAATGGGVMLTTNTTFNMTGGVIRTNYAYLPQNGQGGGVLIGGIHAVFNMSGGVIGDDDPALGNRSSQGGGVLPTYGGTFNMLTPTGGGAAPRIVGNTATGIFYSLGGGGVEIWHGTMNMYAGLIENNRALYGGGVFLESGEFNMHNGIIQNNRYNAYGERISLGGGVKVGNTELVEFNMYGGTIRDNGAINGGGVWVRTLTSNEAIFNLRGGSIYDNDAFNNGGGVNITGANSFFAMYSGAISGNIAGNNGGGVWAIGGPTPAVPIPGASTITFHGADEKIVTENHAVFGGGFYISEDVVMEMVAGAENLYITHNIAIQRGGGIFTETFQYGSPVTRLTGPDRAYRNLILFDVHFNNNYAGHREFSPVNALDVIPYESWSHLSADIHPLNNYDINFIGTPFALPLTGGRGVSWLILAGGASIGVAGLLAMAAYLKSKYASHPILLI